MQDLKSMGTVRAYGHSTGTASLWAQVPAYRQKYYSMGRGIKRVRTARGGPRTRAGGGAHDDGVGGRAAAEVAHAAQQVPRPTRPVAAKNTCAHGRGPGASASLSSDTNRPPPHRPAPRQHHCLADTEQGDEEE